ncbi:MAG: sigma-70 family RNA polymerase sigma factor [Candidatus Fermentithermobacillus carboniphilus]|uniref:Sigma-70 family RNA polymerase sigma factor n=1 Tax=Candidatus Fermentithermobacillus carboniphilus TaxID=3085328 RepID=A0AAT9LCJ5_9FIRM|nr:MAG: sigma-70 family RNA polymerase sigma factor [Candidatus Fermentithermobacillus carboniphilus]
MASEDLALAKRISSGDQEAFEFFFQRYRKDVLRHISTMIEDPAEAEDLTQEVFLRAYHSIHTYSGTASLGRWLRRIATNISIDRMRKKSVPTLAWPVLVTREGTEEPVDFPDDSPSPLDMAQSNEVKSNILKAISSLPPYYKEVVILHDIMNYSGEEIAKRIERPIGTVKSRLSRAHGILMRLLSQGGLAMVNSSEKPANILEGEMVAG